MLFSDVKSGSKCPAPMINDSWAAKCRVACVPFHNSPAWMKKVPCGVVQPPPSTLESGRWKSSAKLVGVDMAKLPETAAAVVTVMMQDPVPLHAPPQPLKDDPASGVALRATVVPKG